MAKKAKSALTVDDIDEGALLADVLARHKKGEEKALYWLLDYKFKREALVVPSSMVERIRNGGLFSREDDTGADKGVEEEVRGDSGVPSAVVDG